MSIWCVRAACCNREFVQNMLTYLDLAPCATPYRWNLWLSYYFSIFNDLSRVLYILGGYIYIFIMNIVHKVQTNVQSQNDEK